MLVVLYIEVAMKVALKKEYFVLHWITWKILSFECTTWSWFIYVCSHSPPPTPAIVNKLMIYWITLVLWNTLTIANNEGPVLVDFSFLSTAICTNLWLFTQNLNLILDDDTNAEMDQICKLLKLRLPSISLILHFIQIGNFFFLVNCS